MKSAKESNDFEKAPFTAIISDIHLHEAEPPHPKHPLWKKFKSREFFFDDQLVGFFGHLNELSNGEPVELILNGDIFDFDSVMLLPEDAPYEVSWLEKIRGLFAEEPKSSFKIRMILKDHPEFVEGLRSFVQAGNRLVIIVGNHDIELHYPQVQKDIIEALELSEEEQERIRFCEWFYISNQDTLVEHGNQYDAFCVCVNPISPMIQKFNRVEVRIPFGDVAGRYMTNGMGFFNPHTDSNYIMSFKEYLKFFYRYLLRTQPLIIWTWFWGAIFTLGRAFRDRLSPELKDPLTLEDKVNEIARKANATPRMARELKELAVHPVTNNPLRMARELWLDRAFIVLVGLFVIFQIVTYIKLAFGISFLWMFIPIFILIPFFIFYAKSISSELAAWKSPDEELMNMASRITRVKRVVHGHTHVARHEHIGEVEHLNSGCWTPAFQDVECTKPYGKKNFVWLSGKEESQREAQLREYTHPGSHEVFKQKTSYIEFESENKAN